MPINHKERAKQLISFDGMERTDRGIIPTDIDGFIDYKGKMFVYMEAKLINAPIPDGQKWALQNAVKSHELAGHKAVSIIFRHKTQAEDIIIAKNQIVDTYYYKYKGVFDWRKPRIENPTLIRCLDSWEKYCEEKKIVI